MTQGGMNERRNKKKGQETDRKTSLKMKMEDILTIMGRQEPGTLKKGRDGGTVRPKK